MVHCISLVAGERLGRLARAFRPGLGDRLGGESERLPAQHARHGELPVTSPSTAPPASARPTGSWGRSTSTAGAARWPGSTTTSTRAVTSGRAAASEPTLLVPTEPHLGLEEVQVEALTAWAAGYLGPGAVYTDAMDGFLPIFFLLVVLKIPVLGALWLSGGRAKPRRPRAPRTTQAAASTAGAHAPRPVALSTSQRRRREEGAGCPSRAAASASVRPVRRNSSATEAERVPRMAARPSQQPLPLLADLPQVGVEVDLDRMALRADEALVQPAS